MQTKKEELSKVLAMGSTLIEALLARMGYVADGITIIASSNEFGAMLFSSDEYENIAAILGEVKTRLP